MAEEFGISNEDTPFVPEFSDSDFDDDLPLEDDLPDDDKADTRKKLIIVSIGAAVLLSLLGLIVGLLMFSGRSNEDDRILENVYAAGINLGGMTVEEAVNALHVATDQSISVEPMVVQIYEETLMLYPSDTKISLDVDALAQAAYNYGRTGSNAENQQIKKNAHKRSYTIPLLPYLNLDLTAIRNTVDNYCVTVDSVYSEPVITLIGTRPTHEDKSPQHQTMRITIGTPLRRLDADDLYDRILDAYSTNVLYLEYETPDVLWPTKVTAQGLFDQYCTPAQDATVDPVTYEITPETYGYGFRIDAAQRILDAAKPGETVEITLSFLEPSLLAQDINNDLFQEKLSECTTMSYSDDNSRETNLSLSCSAINGYVIKPGETFSFIQVLGEVTEEKGYTNAAICGSNNVALGGGISQTASALYYCVLHADLDIMEHHTHTYATDFIELGLDAYVDGISKDLRFRNNTGSPIRIDASVNGRSVTVSLHSANVLSFTISIRSEITAKEMPSITYQMLVANNTEGFKEGDVIVKGIEGYQVAVLKEKTDVYSGNVISTTALDACTYEKRDEVIARIGVIDPEPPEDTQDDTTTTEP